MKKLLIFLLVCLCLSISIYAQNTYDFIIGADAIVNGPYGLDVLPIIKDANYNCLEAVNFNHNDFPAIYNALMKNGFKANVNDRLDYDLNGGRGIEFLTSSNYFRFESEYSTVNTEVNLGDLNADTLFYRFQRDAGHVGLFDQNVSNKRSWVCDYNPVNDSTWKVISGDMYWRWYSPPDTHDFDCVSHICKFSKDWNGNNNDYIQQQYLNDDSLYISIALNWTSLPDTSSHYNDELIQIDFFGYNYRAPDVNDADADTLHNINFQGFHGKYSTTLKISDWRFGTQILNTDFRTFTYGISLAELDKPIQNSPVTLLGGRYALDYLVPIIKWNQNHTVSLDYIEYEDNIHRKMRDQNILDAWIAERLEDQYSSYPQTSILSYMGVNEAYYGNFDSCKRVNDYLIHSASPAAHPLVTNYIPGYNGLFERKKANGKSFSLTKVFNTKAKPSIQKFHYYPIRYNTSFNDTTSSTFIQKNLDTMLEKYQFAKETGLPFYPVVQTYGDWDINDQQWWGAMYPDSTSQKCLQYLPLCYGPSGILNYTVYKGDNKEPALINPDGSLAPNYNIIKAANKKIEVYGPYVKQNGAWYGSECIKTPLTSYPDFSIAGHPGQRLMDISLPFPDSTNNDIYDGYIQCGYYHTGQDNYYMLVNRRTSRVFNSAIPLTTAYTDYENTYAPYGPQTVRFSLLQNARNLYGSNPGLYDPYSHDLRMLTNDYIDITLQPGDASLWQLVSVLPPSINTNYTATRDVCMQGDLHINDGVSVTIPAGKTLNILESGRIYVTDCSSLNIEGNLTANAFSKIYVSQGSSLHISNATCNMGDSTLIKISDGNLVMSHSTFQTKNGTIWYGFNCLRSTITVADCDAYNAKTAIELNATSFNMVNSKLYVPAYGTGICITARNSTDAVNLIGFEDNTNLIKCIATPNTHSTGISMKSRENPLSCNWSIFENLATGIDYSLSVDKADSVSNCTFNGCNTGICVTGSEGLEKIRECKFTIQISQKGIDTSTYIPLIDKCEFSSTHATSSAGIYLDLAQGGYLMNLENRVRENIRNCKFTGLYKGIESRVSSARLKENEFTLNTMGILIRQNSFIDCSDNAKNSFRNTQANFALYPINSIVVDSAFYTIQLIAGHNNIYHDFHLCNDFLFNISDPTQINSGTIDASGNFWAETIGSHTDYTAKVYPRTPLFAHVVDVGICDTLPNVPDLQNAMIMPQNRYEEALSLEELGDFTVAYMLYRQILSDQLIEEKDFWGFCVPSIYRIAKSCNLDMNELIMNYDMELADTSMVDQQQLMYLIRSYIVNAYLSENDYQSAADLISERINKPISEIDSLNAVLDLEIVYMLRDLDVSKKPLTTMYSRYHYPDLPTYKIKHEDNRLKLEALMNKLLENGEETPSPIPTAVFLNRNYPNPFNPTTTIEFGVPKATKVSIRIYNIRGQLVKELVNQKYEPGKFKVVWEGKNSFGKPVATGVYFYRLEAGGKCFTHKMLMLK